MQTKDRKSKRNSTNNMNTNLTVDNNLNVDNDLTVENNIGAIIPYQFFYYFFEGRLHSCKENENVKSLTEQNQVQDILSELERIQDWFLDNQALFFYASSILMICIGDISAWSKPPRPKIKMIDFSHVQKHDAPDRGYLHGLQTIRGILNQLLV